jgi:transcriptional regulator with GAF, ATPase, and Fis domain
MTTDSAEMGTRVISGKTQAAQLTLPGIKLVVVEGKDRGCEHIARRGIIRVGTSKDNDLVVTDDSVSHRHMEIRLRGDEVRVTDLRSTNGTTIDGVKIREAIVTPGAIIRIGDTAFRTSTVEEPITIPLSPKTKFGGLLGHSAAMRQVFGILERVAPAEATILIQGETGTGKEVTAEAVHSHSSRSEGPFMAIDCGAIAANLVESELFGHVKGAFTGAMADRRGVFEDADGGTLFLDEIGELPLSLQPKLLRALETRTIRRVGATQSRPIDVRVVAATNRDLAEEVNRGNFREDLYFRLAVVSVTLPPLRSRREDIPTIVKHFIDRFAPNSPPPSAALLENLAAQAWPGNVRELRNAVERALALAAPTDTVSTDDAHYPSPQESMAPLFALPIKEAIEHWTSDFERKYLENALRQSGGSVSEAARQCGVNRRYVQRMMKRLGMKSGPEDE